MFFFLQFIKLSKIILDMQYLWSTGLRSSATGRFLLLKRLQSTTTATSQNPKTLFTYGKGGHYFLDHIDRSESVR